MISSVPSYGYQGLLIAVVVGGMGPRVLKNRRKKRQKTK